MVEIHVAIGIMKMYFAGRRVKDVHQVVNKMSSSSDVALWNAMAVGYAAAGDIDNAMQLFQNMPKRNVISSITIG